MRGSSVPLAATLGPETVSVWPHPPSSSAACCCQSRGAHRKVCLLALTTAPKWPITLDLAGSSPAQGHTPEHALLQLSELPLQKGKLVFADKPWTSSKTFLSGVFWERRWGSKYKSHLWRRKHKLRLCSLPGVNDRYAGRLWLMSQEVETCSFFSKAFLS